MSLDDLTNINNTCPECKVRYKKSDEKSFIRKYGKCMACTLRSKLPEKPKPIDPNEPHILTPEEKEKLKSNIEKIREKHTFLAKPVTNSSTQ